MEILLCRKVKSLDVKKVSVQTKIDEKDLQKWKDYVSLMKIRTIGPAYANLLHRSDVGAYSTADLRKCNPKELLEKLSQSNKKKRLVKVLPTIAKVEQSINAARASVK